MEPHEERLTIIQHLEELRKRLIWSLVAVAVGFGACYGFVEPLFDFLAAPLVRVLPEGSHLAILSVSEGFFTYLKLGFFAGAFVSSPFVLYQVWAFVSPALKRNEKRYLGPIVAISVLLFVVGIAFGYYVVFPFAFAYLMQYAKGVIVANLSMEWYLSFAVTFLLIFGVVFQLPLILYFLNYIGLVNVAFLKRFRKYAFLLSFIVGAILSPPDVITQTFVSLPLFVLYEASIWIITLVGRKRAAPETAPGTEASTSPATLAG